MKSKVILLILLIVIFTLTVIHAGVPKMINYQGKLTDHQGGLITDTLSIQFAIYDDSISGALLWSETQSQVVIHHGVFSVLLGSVNTIPDSVFDGDVRYLGVKVGDDSEMIPRKVIVSVGYAYRSEYSDTAEYAKVAVSDGDWIIDGDNIYRLNGNIGIGTTSPQVELHLWNPAPADSLGQEVLRISGNYHGSLIGSGPYIKFTDGANQHTGSIRSYCQPGASSVGMLFQTLTIDHTQVDALFLDDDGNVGIGTTAPQAALHVRGNNEDQVIGMGVGTNGEGSLKIVWEHSPVYATKFQTMNNNTWSDVLAIKYNRNVGIGTANPQGKLDIYGSLAVAGNEGIAGQVLTSQGPDSTPVWSDATVILPDNSVSQAKLKTATGEVSASVSNTVLSLPGGEYGFYYQNKVDKNCNLVSSIYGDGNAATPITAGAYATYGFIHHIDNGATAYIRQRYITASGKDHWIFMLVAKKDYQVLNGRGELVLVKGGQVVSSYQAPDHPSAHQGGANELDIPHPFGGYDSLKHELILVHNEILPELKSKVTSKRSLLTIINEDYEIDFDYEPVYQPREIIEIDEYGDKKGEILKVIKTPEWAKILIGKDKIYLKRRLVETLPSYISYKKLNPKSNGNAGYAILSQDSGIESEVHERR